jgi:hypothetical protein
MILHSIRSQEINITIVSSKWQSYIQCIYPIGSQKSTVLYGIYYTYVVKFNPTVLIDFQLIYLFVFLFLRRIRTNTTGTLLNSSRQMFLVFGVFEISYHTRTYYYKTSPVYSTTHLALKHTLRNNIKYYNQHCSGYLA